jgi:hypothetical protein
MSDQLELTPPNEEVSALLSLQADEFTHALEATASSGAKDAALRNVRGVTIISAPQELEFDSVTPGRVY